MSAQPPQPTLAWQFETSNVDYVTGLAPNLSTTGNYAAPTGGTITTVAGQRIHTFTSVGTTSITFLVPVTVQVLVVAGGGGGGGCGTNNQTGGGGGAGELYYNASYSIPAGTYTVTVGAGGTRGLGSGTSGGSPTSGGDSIFGTIDCNGGGYGGANGGKDSGAAGGSGGGASRGSSGGASVKTAAGFGNIGGDSAGSLAGGSAGGGGGGGAGGAGADAGGGNGTSAAGGAGRAYSISGASVTYAAGGSGGSRNGTADGAAGTTNRGNGGEGGDGASTTNGGNGGSGIVIISYVSALYPSPTYVPGVYGQAINFNNQTASATFANSYVTYTLTSGTSNSYSLSCWINPLHAIPPTINPNYVVLRDTGGYYSLQNFASSSIAGFYANEGAGTGITQSGLLTTGKWDHHCFVLSNVGATSSNTIATYYFNGTTQASGNVQRTNGFSIFSALDLGYRSGSNNSGAWCSVDDARLFNTALNAAQVKTIYAARGMPNQMSLNGSGTTYMNGVGTITLQ